jgi:hypothetical protein
MVCVEALTGRVSVCYEQTHLGCVSICYLNFEIFHWYWGYMSNDLISQMVWYWNGLVLPTSLWNFDIEMPKPMESVLHINSSQMHTWHEIGRSILVFDSCSQMHNSLNLNATKMTLCSQFKSVAWNATTSELGGL